MKEPLCTFNMYSCHFSATAHCIILIPFTIIMVDLLLCITSSFICHYKYDLASQRKVPYNRYVFHLPAAIPPTFICRMPRLASSSARARSSLQIRKMCDAVCLSKMVPAIWRLNNRRQRPAHAAAFWQCIRNRLRQWITQLYAFGKTAITWYIAGIFPSPHQSHVLRRRQSHADDLTGRHKAQSLQQREFM